MDQSQSSASLPRTIFPVGRARSLPVTIGLSLVLSVCFIYFPWDAVSGKGFPDRDNYVDAIAALLQNGAKHFEIDVDNIPAVVLTESLWREISIFIGQNFEDPVAGLLLCSLVALAVTTFVVIQRAGVSYACIFLLAPLSIDLYMSQNRSALAMAIFLFALVVRRPVVRYSLFLVAFLVHSLVAILFLTYLFNAAVLAASKDSTRRVLTAALLLGVLAAGVYAFLAQDILSAVGDRRALQEASLPATARFALWWIVLTPVFVAFARIKTFPGNGQIVMFAVCLQAIFVFTTLFGAGALRFLSLALPFTMIAIRSIREPPIRMGAIAGTIAFNLMHTLLWVA
jgi:hypothetical protein